MIGRPTNSGLEKLTDAYGVKVDPAMVLDVSNERITVNHNANGMNFQSLVSFPALIRVQDLAKDTPMTKNLAGFSLPFAAPLELEPREGVAAEVVARSSPKSWVYEINDSFLADPQAMPQPDPTEALVPHNLLVALNGRFPSYFKDHPLADDAGRPADPPLTVSPDNRVVVVGSSLWASDLMQNRLNAVLLANLVDWLMQDERLTLIRARTVDNHPLRAIGDAQRAFFKYGNMLLPPLALVIFGVFRWRRRLRAKRRLATAYLATAGGEE
jgi:ABC-type uncharacterized transport system involved in gliding motility auxiliary subunit